MADVFVSHFCLSIWGFSPLVGRRQHKALVKIWQSHFSCDKFGMKVGLSSLFRIFEVFDPFGENMIAALNWLSTLDRYSQILAF